MLKLTERSYVSNLNKSFNAKQMLDYLPLKLGCTVLLQTVQAVVIRY